jgi:AraC family transcriptional activator of pobA
MVCNIPDRPLYLNEETVISSTAKKPGVRMIDIKHLNDAPELDLPRRIRKYVLIWCSSGSVTIAVDENEFALRAGTVITITSGQIHHIKSKRAPKGFVLEFTYDFFCKNDADIELIFHNSLFCHFAMNEVIPLGSSHLVGQELSQIEKELTGTPYQYLNSIHSRIELILVEINQAPGGKPLSLRRKKGAF